MQGEEGQPVGGCTGQLHLYSLNGLVHTRNLQVWTLPRCFSFPGLRRLLAVFVDSRLLGTLLWDGFRLLPYFGLSRVCAWTVA